MLYLTSRRRSRGGGDHRDRLRGRRAQPGFRALIVCLPLVSVLGMLWLWRDATDPVRLVSHAQTTFWFVLPSLPMFLLIPTLPRRGMTFLPAWAWAARRPSSSIWR